MNSYFMPGNSSCEDILLIPLELLFLPLIYCVDRCCWGSSHIKEAVAQSQRCRDEARAAHYGTAPTPEPAMTRVAPAAPPPTRPEVQSFSATAPPSPAPAATTSLGAGAPPAPQALGDKWIVQRSDLQLGEELGGGSFGRVFAARWRGTAVAVKVFTPEGGSAAEAAAFTAVLLPKIRAEAALLAALRHPNVVAFYGVLEGGAAEPPCVVTELCARGSLLDVLRGGKAGAAAAAELTWRRRLGLALDAAAGMLHLHEQAPPVLHRDLKSPNLLVTADWRCKVADLGLSKLLDDAAATTTAGGAGNPRWTAPEVLQGGRASVAADVFAFGIVLWELLTWELPWAHLTGARVYAVRLGSCCVSRALRSFSCCCCNTDRLPSPPLPVSPADRLGHRRRRAAGGAGPRRAPRPRRRRFFRPRRVRRLHAALLGAGARRPPDLCRRGRRARRPASRVLSGAAELSELWLVNISTCAYYTAALDRAARAAAHMSPAFSSR